MSAEIIFIPQAIMLLAGLITGQAVSGAVGTAFSLSSSTSRVKQHENKIAATLFTDGEILKNALEQSGYKVRTFDKGINAKQGKAELDFILQEDNTYQMVSSSIGANQQILEKLTTAYKKACQTKMHKNVVETLKKKGYQAVKEQTDETGNIILTLRSWK